MKSLKILLIAALAVVAGACSKNEPTAAEVAAKIDAHQALSESDYSVMIDYCGDYAKNAQHYFDLINEQPSDSTQEYMRAANELAALRAANPYLDMFQTAIYAANDDQLGKENVEKVNKFSKYIAFPLPEGSGPNLTQPNVEGEIMDMPDSDTAGVIAAPDGEAVSVQ